MTKELNSFYKKSDERIGCLIKPFLKIHAMFEYHMAYLKGTYEKLKNGRYIEKSYPVSTIVVHDYGYVMVDDESIYVYTKISIQNLEKFDFRKLEKYDYEAYSSHERNYVFFKSIDDINVKNEKLKTIYDSEVEFEFSFDETLAPDELYDFFKVLKRYKFHDNTAC